MRFLKRFQTPTIGLYVLSMILFVGLWVLSIYSGNAREEEAFLFLNQFTLFTLSPLWSHIIQGLVLILLWVGVTRYFEMKEFLPVRSAIPFFVGLLLTLCMPCLWYFNHHTFAFILFVMALVGFQELNTDPIPLSAAFNVGLLMTVAALFNANYWILLPIFIIGIFVYRLYNIRLLGAVLFGICVPLFIVFSIAFLIDQVSVVSHLIWKLEFFDFSQGVNLQIADWIIFIFFALLCIISLLSYYTASSGYKLNVRLNFKFSTLSLLYILAWIVLFLPDYQSHIMCLIVFINMLLSLYFTLVRNKLSHVLFLLFVLVCIVVNLSNIWSYSN